ncbi:MAG: peptidase M14, partial [Anaerolineae bacterium]
MPRPLALLLVLALLLPASVFAQTPQPPELPQTPFVGRIAFHSRTQLAALSAELDVWEVHPQEGYLLAALTPVQAADLQARGYTIQADSAKTALLTQPPQEIPYQVSGIPGYPCYRTVEETYADLSALAAAHPTLAQWVDIGDSWEKTQPGGSPGYDIYALVLTNQNIPGPKPKFFLMAAIHARELTTAETATRFAEYLLNNYGRDPDATFLLDYTEIHIVPQANPDGRKMAETGEYWRKNTDDDDGCTTYPDYGTDLNRNSSFMWGGSGSSGYACSETYRGPSPASEPEVQAIQNYVRGIFPDQRGSNLSDPAPADATGVFITLHSYSQLVLWPWGFDYPQAPNHTQLQTLGRKFAYFNGYSPSQASDLYPAAGTTDDWAYGELGIAAYTFELGNFFFESCAAFENTVYPDNLPALLYAAKASRRPYQSPAGPEVLNVTVTPTTTVPGLPLTITAQADDTRYGTLGGLEPAQNVAAARFSIDAPSWVTGTLTYNLSPADGAWDNTSEALTAQFDPSGLGLAPGRHMLFIEAKDALGHWGVPTAAFFWMPDYGFQVNPLEAAQYGLPGETLTYTLHLTNSASLSDTYTLSLSGNRWG